MFETIILDGKTWNIEQKGLAHNEAVNIARAERRTNQISITSHGKSNYKRNQYKVYPYKGQYAILAIFHNEYR
jgi:hypothetical protein